MKVSFKILLGTLCALFLIFSCAKQELDPFGSINGKVMDGLSKDPLSGVIVTLSPEGLSKSTGSDGRYEFKNLSPGSYTIGLSKEGYTSDNKSVSVHAGSLSTLDQSMMAIQSQLAVNVERLDFEGDKTTLPIEIRNTGKGALQWQVHENVDWLSCNVASGSTSTEVTTVVFTVNRVGLSKGTYTQSLTISSNGGSKTVNISMTVSGASLTATPTVLNFEEVITSLMLQLENENKTGNIVFSIEKSHEWIAIDKTSGVLDNQSSSSSFVNVVVNRTGLSAGNFTGELIVKSNVMSDLRIPVYMTVRINQAPLVLMGNVSEIMFNGVKASGAIFSVGSSKITQHGFCWSKNANPTVADSHSGLGDKMEMGEFSSPVTGLEANTDYYVRAYAVNSVGTAYSSQVQFKTSPLPVFPTISTEGATEVTFETAKVSANLSHLGNTTVSAHGFIWSATNQNLTTALATKTDRGQAVQTASFATVLTQLQPGVTYSYRAYATNMVGTAYGEVKSFTASTTDVRLSTSAVKDIFSSTAIGGGVIQELGGNDLLERGVCWGIHANPTILSNSAKSTGTAAAFTAKLTGLMPLTSYHLRAYAKTATQVFYGNDVSFTSAEQMGAPSVITLAATDVAATAGQLNGNLMAIGDASITAHGHIWSLSASDLTTDLATKTNRGAALGTGSFSSSVTSFQPVTTYYYRAYATNAEETFYGEVLSLVTPPKDVLLTTSDVSDITHNTVVSGGTITDIGGNTISGRGVCWNTSPNPVVTDDHVESSEGTTASFALTLTGLQPATQYYIRAYVRANGKVYYGMQKMFRTGFDIDMVDIPGGTFTMGSPPNTEVDRGSDEKQHQVTLSAFKLGKYEVTQALWKAVMSGSNPSLTKGDDLPVEQVSWYDVQTFLTELNRLTGKKYILPTEAQWEYACRAGTTSPFNTGFCLTDSQANYNWRYAYGSCTNTNTTRPGKTQSVGSYAPNSYGLYDMHGNVYEWCSDWYGTYPTGAQTNPEGPTSGSFRVFRGGSWLINAQGCRSADRSGDAPDNRGNDIGFRLALCP